MSIFNDTLMNILLEMWAKSSIQIYKSHTYGATIYCGPLYYKDSPPIEQIADDNIVRFFVKYWTMG